MPQQLLVVKGKRNKRDQGKTSLEYLKKGVIEINFGSVRKFSKNDFKLNKYSLKMLKKSASDTKKLTKYLKFVTTLNNRLSRLNDYQEY